MQFCFSSWDKHANNTLLKVKLFEKKSFVEAFEARVKELNMKVDEQQKLISNLE